MGPLLDGEIDVELLLKTDAWLESESTRLKTEMSLLAEDLDHIISTQRFKRDLQQKNLVPFYQFDCQAATLRVCSLREAIRAVRQDRRPEHCLQLKVWESDGYDVRCPA